jgi:FtsZ-interacting cell division protein ZipA
MTTTHYVLIGLGAALIAGLLLYNFLQERRFRKQADRMFAHKRGDILLGDTDIHAGMEDGRIEPRLQLSGEEEGGASPSDDGRHDVGGAVVQSLESLPSTASGALEEPARAAVNQGPPSFPTEAAAPVTRPREDASKPSREAGIDLGAVAPASRPAAPGLPPSPLDADVEYVARLSFAQPARLSFARLIDGLRRLGKPIRTFGLRQEGGWEEVGRNPAAPYVAVELGVQLADRTGPVSDTLLDGFCRELYHFATEHGGAVSCPERKSALERARDLDQFCMEVDVLIGLNIVAREGQALSGEDIDAVAAGAGLVLNHDGAYVLRGVDGHSLFSLVNQEEMPFTGAAMSTHGISLLFDVPRIADGLKVFDRMTELGFRLADQLKGQIVDDSGRAVTQETLMKDRQRLGAYYARMQARGIVPGSERALRLFR